MKNEYQTLSIKKTTMIKLKKLEGKLKYETGKNFNHSDALEHLLYPFEKI